MGEWKFRRMTKSEKLVDPIQSQFFTTNIVGGLTAALVREAVQNSLDANLRLNSEVEENGDVVVYPVEVRFFLSGMSKSIPQDVFSKYTKGLIPHILAQGNGLPVEQRPDFQSPTPYLLIEDSNTRGLEGDPLESEDPGENDKENHNFYWFWRNVGRSGKGHGDRGRWGLGKTVFPAASKINTFFGLTVRYEDGKRLLMGQSVLKIHHIHGEDVKFCPYGDFGEFHDSDPYFVSPVKGTKELDDFEENFCVERMRKARVCAGYQLLFLTQLMK